MRQTEIQLSQLRHGHHPEAPAGVVNVRVTGRDFGLEALAASILSLGVLQPLVVVPGDAGFHYVVDGNRRLAALESLLAEGKLTADAEVPVIVRDAGTAREAGLAANVLQTPMHEADQMLAFAELRRNGMTEKAIAAKFAQPVATVRRLLALGGVSPAVLDAWRIGKVRTDDVKSFTLASHADQDRALAKVLADGSVWRIREYLGANDDIAHLLAYVGAKAYKAAGASSSRTCSAAATLSPTSPSSSGWRKNASTPSVSAGAGTAGNGSRRPTTSRPAGSGPGRACRTAPGR